MEDSWREEEDRKDGVDIEKLGRREEGGRRKGETEGERHKLVQRTLLFLKR